jgi:DNA-binding NarL/FixJ family response regulator
VDDHVPTRAGIRAALDGRGFRVCGESGTCAGAVELARRERPDLCLLDIDIPGGGIAAAASIASQLPETAIVMLTVSASDSDLFDALRAGARGYLLKDTPAAQLPGILHAVLAGESVLSPRLVALVLDEFRDRGRRRPLHVRGEAPIELTSREWEVLDLLRQGATTSELAQRLFVSPVTVRRHVSSILHKLRVPDRQAAVALLARSG